MDRNITDSTCSYGLAQTSAGCVSTLASLDESAYTRAQITYLAVGLVLASITGFLTLRAYRNECPKLQQHSLLLLFYSSLTFVLRGVDPMSYKHVVPRPIAIFFTDSCTAALYSIYIMSLLYWATIIQQGAAQLQRPLRLRRLEQGVIAFVWVFFVVVDAYTFTTKGFQATALQFVQMIGCAAILSLVSAAFLVYGLRVMSRLRVFERYVLRVEQAKELIEDDTTNTRSPGGSFASAYSSKAFSQERDLERPPPQVAAPKKQEKSDGGGHAARIRNILLVVEIFAVIVIVVQLYMGISQASDSPAELNCANGTDCDSVHCKIAILHWLQVVCIIVIGGVFWNTQRKTQPEPLSSPEE